MSFQETAESLQARLHLGKLRPPAFMGALLLAGVFISACVFGAFQLVSDHSFSVESASSQKTGEGSVAKDGDSSAEAPEESLLCVHVSGCVRTPGVYELSEGLRVADAVELAGGALEEANLDAVNLARILQDGEQIYVPALGDSTAAALASGGSGELATGASALVNINTATAEELTKLDGVGGATAKKIVADRLKNGPFSSVEDIKRVSGIGDKKFEALKDSICV